MGEETEHGWTIEIPEDDESAMEVARCLIAFCESDPERFASLAEAVVVLKEALAGHEATTERSRQSDEVAARAQAELNQAQARLIQAILQEAARKAQPAIIKKFDD